MLDYVFNKCEKMSMYPCVYVASHAKSSGLAKSHGASQRKTHRAERTAWRVLRLKRAVQPCGRLQRVVPTASASRWRNDRHDHTHPEIATRSSTELCNGTTNAEQSRPGERHDPGRPSSIRGSGGNENFLSRSRPQGRSGCALAAWIPHVIAHVQKTDSRTGGPVPGDRA